MTTRRGPGTPEDFKAVQIGGPSGACLSPRYLDLPLEFDSLKAINAMVGSGGLVVMNQDTCMVQVARFFMQFTQSESCGKCVLCREGTYQMLVLLDDIIEGRADERTIGLLESVARAVGNGSLCGLGKSAPNPVLSILRDFRGEFDAHIAHKRCPANKCTALIRPVHRRVQVPRLRSVRQVLSDRCHHRRAEASAHHQRGPLHPLRCMPYDLQTWRDRVRTPWNRHHH